MLLTTFIHDVTEHLKTYLFAGTLVAVGVDVTGNVSGNMRGETGGMMTAMMPVPDETSIWVVLGVQGVGLLIAAVGAALYLGNMWNGFVALRQFRFRFKERGLVLRTCGWGAAFVYVLTATVIGLAVNAVYLALVT